MGGCFLGNFPRIGPAIVVVVVIAIVVVGASIVGSASWCASSSDEFLIYISWISGLAERTRFSFTKTSSFSFVFDFFFD
jgi:hypothetical protein